MKSDMDSIVSADIKSWSNGIGEAKRKLQKVQNGVKLTNGFDHQTQEMNHKVSFSKIYKEVYELAYSKQLCSEKVIHALNVIEESLRQYGPNGVSLSFNGGKDCMVLLHLFAAAYYKHFQDSNKMPSIQALYIKHQKPFPEVEDFIKECVDRYCLDLFTIEGPMKLALANYLDQRPNVQAILVGTRRNDPHGEKLSDFTPTDPGWPSFMRVNPILDFHYTQIWEFIRTLNVPYCKLYDLGFTSLGSNDSTYPNPVLKNQNGYYPAWKLTDESKERCGRDNEKQEISQSQTPSIPKN